METQQQKHSEKISAVGMRASPGDDPCFQQAQSVAFYLQIDGSLPDSYFVAAPSIRRIFDSSKVRFIGKQLRTSFLLV